MYWPVASLDSGHATVRLACPKQQASFLSLTPQCGTEEPSEQLLVSSHLCFPLFQFSSFLHLLEWVGDFATRPTCHVLTVGSDDWPLEHFRPQSSLASFNDCPFLSLNEQTLLPGLYSHETTTVLRSILLSDRT